MIFKIYDCDFGIKVNGQSYEFTHVVSVAIDDPERNNLTRGANAGNLIGVSYKEGMKEPKKWTVPVIDIPIDLKAVLDDCYDNQTRCDVYCIDRATGSSKMARNALLANHPEQVQLDDTVDSMNVSLEFVTFDSTENFKAAPTA